MLRSLVAIAAVVASSSSTVGDDFGVNGLLDLINASNKKEVVKAISGTVETFVGIKGALDVLQSAADGKGDLASASVLVQRAAKKHSLYTQVQTTGLITPYTKADAYRVDGADVPVAVSAETTCVKGVIGSAVARMQGLTAATSVEKVDAVGLELKWSVLSPTCTEVAADATALVKDAATKVKAILAPTQACSRIASTFSASIQEQIGVWVEDKVLDRSRTMDSVKGKIADELRKLDAACKLAGASTAIKKIRANALTYAAELVRTRSDPTTVESIKAKFSRSKTAAPAAAIGPGPGSGLPQPKKPWYKW